MRSKKALTNIATNLLLEIIVIINGFIVPKIIISNFGSNVNGLIASITQFLGYITLLESGFGPVVKAALYKPIAKKDDKAILGILKSSERFFRTIAIIFVIYIAGLSLVYPLIINNEFDYFYTLSLVIIIGISTFAEYFFGMAYRLFLQAKQKTYIISIIQIVSYILSLMSILILVKIDANIHIIKLVSGIIFVLRPLLQNYYVKKKYNIKLSEVKEKYEIKQKWDGLAQHIAAVIHSKTDITLITIFCSLAEVSVYSVYYLIIKSIKSFIQSFITGIDSSFGDMIANDEAENLNKKFNLYEIIYFIICTIIFTATIILITPFVSVYTKGIADANYIRYTFGYLIVISEYVWAIRQPYNELVKSSGHFKETRIGAWVECLSNIIISIILINKLGIVGVAIGTIVAMSIRTIEFVYHTSKYILKRTIFDSLKKIVLVVIETVVIVYLSKYLPLIESTSYVSWLYNALFVSFEAVIVVFITSIIFYKNEIFEILKLLKKILRRKAK